MKSLVDIALALRAAMAQQGKTQRAVRTDAGLAGRTVTRALSGTDDFKVSTLLALADRLGMEMLLVPKGSSSGGVPPGVDVPVVRTRVQAALDREGRR